MTESDQLFGSPEWKSAKKQLMEVLLKSTRHIQGVRPARADDELKKKYSDAIRQFNMNRGRDLFFPFLSSGIGNGPWVELQDGSVKYDMITGIGINFFGHSHPQFMSTLLDAVPSDVMQGNLQPGYEAQVLVDRLVAIASSGGSHLKHAWLTTCGTMANEIALKIIRQRRAPATRVFAFEDCFSGRSTAMQELTDNPKYREGQPSYGEVVHLPFYDETIGIEASVGRVLQQIRWHLERFPGKFAGIVTELVQGEGGFRTAPREFFAKIFEEAKKANLAVWIDEVQTFGRTGEYFAFQKLELQAYVDVVTTGKMLQACATLFSKDYNPRPGLVAGTFSGSAAALKTALTTLDLLQSEKLLGEDGKIAKLSQHFERNLQELKAGRCKGKIGQIRVLGGMVAVEPTPGTLEHCKQVLMKLYDLGLVAFYCGHGPYLIRMLPPLGAMEEKHVDDVCDLIAKAL